MPSNPTQSLSSAPPNAKATQPRRLRGKKNRQPPLLCMTPQRQQILAAVHRYQALSRSQIQRLTGYASRNTVNYALGLLHEHGYLERCFARPLTTEAGENHQAIYLLDRKGAEFLAAQQDLADWRELGWKASDNQISPWHLPHLIACNDILIRFAQAAQSAKCQVDWLAERDLRQPERQAQVEIQLPGGQRKRLGVVADAYILLISPQGQRLACFLECDRGTLDIEQRWATKIRAYEAFLRSPLYPKCFPFPQDAVAVLTVTTNPQRLAQLKATTERMSRADFFLFSTFADIASANLLTNSVWYISQRNSHCPLFPFTTNVNLPASSQRPFRP